MMWDSDIVDGIHHEGKSGSELELRDAQLTLVGKLNKIWKTELQMLWGLGFYEIDKKDSDHNLYAITGRLTYTPWHQHDNLLHLGIADSIRDFDGEKYQINTNYGGHCPPYLAVMEGLENALSAIVAQLGGEVTGLSLRKM
ncbi:hypothetical protein THII_3757 [Thioploca ingrica]|uniref:Uncharacterized protein n=1 Tax=Thioploca ingrica TaxID=40754 RepID=A0A090AKG6_9GAMM|nr:hypothetical protein THII_3757 [Thioploca ingrica]